MTKKLKFALFGNVYQERKCAAVQKFFAIAHEKKADIAIHEPFFEFLRDNMKINVPECEVFKDRDFTADYVICMGGDGTFLDAASKVGDKEIPVIGINTGRLGFLASFSPDRMKDTMEDIYSGFYDVEQHSVLQISCDELQLQDYPFALNEIAILKHDISSMITIHTDINNEYLTAYQADGLIIGTPTGSTAYSLSAGGPVVDPKLECMILTPICSHSVFTRSLVLGDDAVLRIYSDDDGPLSVSCDGDEPFTVSAQGSITVEKADICASFIRLKNDSFVDILNRKMMKWNSSSHDEREV